jgi:hypothetical protein
VSGLNTVSPRQNKSNQPPTPLYRGSADVAGGNGGCATWSLVVFGFSFTVVLSECDARAAA